MNSDDNVTILVVDDNPTNLRVLIDYLEDSGYETMVAPSGERAIQQLERALPDLILLDVMMMPGIDGFETCRRLKSNNRTKDIPVIFMTALSETVNKVKGFELGAVDYITKPFQQEEVLVRIRTHLTIQYQKKEMANLNNQLQNANSSLTEMNLNLTEANAKLTEAIATKDKFFTIVTENIGTAFSPLIKLSSLITNSAESLNDTIKNYAQNIQSKASSTQQLLENLFGWALIQRGIMNYNPKRIYLFGLISDNIKYHERDYMTKQIDVINEISPETIIYADFDMLDRVIYNLLSNAIKFTDYEGQIKISSKSLGDYEEISIADTGIGITQDNLRKIFKVTNTSIQKGTKGEQGTGLGLILCKELIEKNDGKIWISSEPDHGTTVKITLPKHKHDLMLGT